MTQKLRLDIEVTGEQTTVGGIGGGINKIQERLSASQVLPDGTTTGKAERMWGDARTVTAGAVDALELDNLPSIAGPGAVTFSKIKGLVVKNLSATGYLTLGGGSGGKTAPAADAWSGTDAGVVGSPFSADASTIHLGPGDVFAWSSLAGVSVVTTNGDELGVEAFTANQDYEILMWGND